ncbi:MAG: P22 phage major capsid protein family protein [Rickettsiales bacterium]
MATTGKIAEVLFENALETYEHQMQMLDLVEVFNPNSADMQNANNVVWRPVQQHAPVLDGWDLTGQETDIIEETYPAILGTPKNDFFSQRADDLRDMQFWERRGKQSGMKQATELNKGLAQLVATTGSLFYRSNATSGYDFIAQAQATMNERQFLGQGETERYFLLNDRSNLTYGSDLAGRQTLQGRPEQTWKTGQIGQNVAEFDVYTGSFLANLTGGPDPATTVTGDQSFAPEGGSVNATTQVVTNVDYRSADIPVAASGSYNVGDKIQFANGGTPVESVGLADKSATNQPMTFTIVDKPDATTITVFPKPIALDDPALSTLEAAYANINTRILNTATVNRLNTDASAKTNIFWAKNSIEVTGGDAPIELLSEFGGMKVISETMSNGQKMYMAYDGNIDNLTFKCRLFTWYGLTNKNPSANGVAVSF